MACDEELFRNTDEHIRCEAEELAIDEQWITVGDLINILEPLNHDARIFLRNLDEWGDKIVIKDGFSYSEVSDGLIEKVLISNIDQKTLKYEYVIIQGLVNYNGFETVDREPYTIPVYKNEWFERFIERVTPVTTMKQLKEKFFSKKR